MALTPGADTLWAAGWLDADKLKQRYVWQVGDAPGRRNQSTGCDSFPEDHSGAQPSHDASFMTADCRDTAFHCQASARYTAVNACSFM